MSDSQFEKQCQSCGMPLKDGLNSGSEVDGSKSHTYCVMCYQDGKFTGAITLPEMKQVVNQALKEKGWWAPLRWMALWQLPTLKRWKNQK